MHPPLLKPLLVATSSLVLLAAGSRAQASSDDFRIVKITPEFVKTADYSFSSGPTGKSIRGGRNFLAVETVFDWLPRKKGPTHLDEVVLNYYVLLNNKGVDPDNPKETLLTGSVTHVSIPQEKELKSVMYVSPRSLDRLFGGKVPSTVNTAIIDVGVSITVGGEVVAQASTKSDLTGKKAWWDLPDYQVVKGYLLNKDQTPFGPLVWDYYEEIKPAGE